MKEPSLKSFWVRVGGLTLIFLLAIHITNNYYPGYQIIAIFTIGGIVILAALIKSLVKKGKKVKEGLNFNGTRINGVAESVVSSTTNQWG